MYGKAGRQVKVQVQVDKVFGAMATRQYRNAALRVSSWQLYCIQYLGRLYLVVVIVVSGAQAVPD